MYTKLRKIHPVDWIDEGVLACNNRDSLYDDLFVGASQMPGLRRSP